MEKEVQSYGRGESGFTLIELMITVAVLAILLGIATADYGPVVNNNRLVAAVNQLQGELGFARSSAASSSSSLTFCSSSDGASCSGNTNWESGWLIFTDADGDRAVDSDDRIIKVNSGLEGVSMRRAGFSFPTGVIQFNSRGELMGNAATSGSFIFCGPDSDESVARGVVLQISGASRLMVDENSDNIVNNHAGGDVTCP